MVIEPHGRVWVDVPAWSECPACRADWRPPDRYMRSYRPCGCSPPDVGHRVYLCKACGVTSHHPPHTAITGQLSNYPTPLPKRGGDD